MLFTDTVSGIDGLAMPAVDGRFPVCHTALEMDD